MAIPAVAPMIPRDFTRLADFNLILLDVSGKRKVLRSPVISIYWQWGGLVMRDRPS